MQEKVTCKTCYFWQERPDVELASNTAQGVIARVEKSGLMAGDCTGFPPVVHIVPVRTLKGDALAPQSFDRQTLSNRPCCHLHQDAPINNVQQRYIDRASGLIDTQEAQHKAFQEMLGGAAPLSPVIAMQYPGDKDNN